MTLITPRWCAPCSCPDCVVAQVTNRRRPYPECHGRDLLRWWLEYERFQFAAKAAMKPMPKATVQTRPDGEPV